MANNPVPFKSIASYTPLSDTQSQNFLAQFMPKGKLFARVFDPASNLYKLIFCLADVFKQLTAQLYILFYSRNFSQINELLPEWENSVGIPSIFPRLSTTTQRQTAIQTLVSKIPVINTQPYALGTMAVNNVTGIVTVTLTTAVALTGQTSVIVTNATNPNLNGTFPITVLSYNTFTYSIASVDGIGIISTNSGAVLVTNTGKVIQAAGVTDSGNFAFNSMFPLNTTYEQFVYNMTGIQIHIYFNPFGVTNTFPMTFPIVFGAAYNQALLLFNILVVGSILNSTQLTALNTALNWVIPTMAAYQIAGYVTI